MTESKNTIRDMLEDVRLALKQSTDDDLYYNRTGYNPTSEYTKANLRTLAITEALQHLEQRVTKLENTIHD